LAPPDRSRLARFDAGRFLVRDASSTRSLRIGRSPRRAGRRARSLPCSEAGGLERAARRPLSPKKVAHAQLHRLCCRPPCQHELSGRGLTTGSWYTRSATRGRYPGFAPERLLQKRDKRLGVTVDPPALHGAPLRRCSGPVSAAGKTARPPFRCGAADRRPRHQ